MLRWAKRILPALAVLIGSAVYIGVRRNRDAPLPAPAGSFAVGRRVFVWPSAAHLKDPPPLLVWIWYPAALPSGSPTAPYLPEPWMEARKRQSAV